MVGHAMENSLTTSEAGPGHAMVTMSEAIPGPSVISMHRMSSYVKCVTTECHPTLAE